MLSRFLRPSPARLLQVSAIARGIRSGTRSRTVSTDPAEHFHYTRAIVGSLTKSFAANSVRFQEPAEPIDLTKALADHENYVREIKKLIPHVVQIPPHEETPEMVFVEDPAIVRGGKALMAQMPLPSRTQEVRPVRPILEEMGLEIFEVDDPEAALDGGNVVFTGREFLVGISRRTNEAGVKQVQRAFPEWPVTGIRVSHPVVHLSSMSSMCGVDTIAIGDSEAGKYAWKQIETQSHFKKYKRLVFPDNNGANCLFISGTILHPPEVEYPESYKVWQTVDLPKVELPNSELSKADGSLTCNSLRIP